MIIFDFDGTLANTHHLILKHYNAFAERNPWFNLAVADHEFQQNARGMTMLQARKELQIPYYKLMLIVPMIRRALFNDYRPEMLFDGVATILEDFYQSGIDLAILSSNKRKAMQKVLDIHFNKMQFVIDNCFFRKGRVLKKIAKLHPGESHTYISDAAADVVAAREAGLNTVAVSWGLHDEDFLKASNPDYLVHTRAELRDVLNYLHPAK